MSTATTTRVRKVPEMGWAQHKLFWALSVIEEEALVNFFRAVRKGAVRPLLLDEINAELDKGIGLEEMFASSPDILKITDNTCVELMVMWWERGDLKCMIRLGEMEWAGPGAEWVVRFDSSGQVISHEVEHIWKNDLKE